MLNVGYKNETQFATSANKIINDCIIAGLKCSWNNWFGIPRLAGNAGGRVITSLACSRVCNVWKHNARRILCFWRSSFLQHVRDIRQWISNYVFARVARFHSDHWPWIYVVSAVSRRFLFAFVLNARRSRHGGLFRQKPGGDVDVVHMWHICGTGIKTSGETTLAPSNFVHLVHGVQSGWKMKIDGLVRLSKGWFQDNPCHSVFIVLTSCLNVFAVCSPAVRRLPWWRRGQDDLMPRSSMQQQCN